MTSDKHIVERAAEAGIEVRYCAPDGNDRDAAPEVLQALIDQLDKYERSGFTDYFLARPECCGYFSLPFVITAAMRFVLIDEHGDTCELESVDRKRRWLYYPPLAAGYHELKITDGDTPLRFLIIVAPARVYEPESLHAGEKMNGLTISLYSLRSLHNWGIGDFGDLERLVRLAAEHTLDFVAINPLHALFLSDPEWNSPYSPSSRRWLNPVYLDVTAVAAFTESPRAQRWSDDPKTVALLASLRGTEVIDYRTVWAVKKRALEMAFTHFQDAESSRFVAARRKFTDFIAAQGEALYDFALFEALDAVCCDPPTSEKLERGWLTWPEAYRDPRSEAVRVFAAAHEPDIRFYMWLQWLCDQQLQRLRQVAVEQGLALGIYGDLAIGVVRGGADTWRESREYCLPMTIGAPPDSFAPHGQNWNLPPWHPRRLIKSGFQPFIDLLRTNMGRYAMLRIDHVMGLERLWWITHGTTARDGAYVRYPVDAMIAILALESHRARCLVIGEDLGNVSQRIRAMLTQYGVYTSSVLRFARTGARYLAPECYPKQALTVTSTHDLAPLGGYWSGRDLNTMRQLGLFANEDSFKQAQVEREADKRALFRRLQASDSVPQTACLPRKLTPELRLAVHLFGAAAPSKLYAMQIENILPMEDNFNMPGVACGYPNWAVKLPSTISEIAHDRRFTKTIDAVCRTRKS